MATKKAPKWGPCVECGNKKVVESENPALAGMVICPGCGKLQIGQSLIVTKEDLESIEIPDGFSPAIPDYAEVALGWRAWQIRRKRGQLILQSCVHTECWWPARTEVRAQCDGSPNCKYHGADKIPAGRHSCGLYSANTREHLLTMAYPQYDPDSGDFTAIGKVKLWGKVIECSLGWRAEFGYPQMIEVPHAAWGYAEELEDVYGVSVELANTTK